MNDVCSITDCTKDGNHFRDRTTGPLCNYRYYCDDHIAASDMEAVISSKKRTVAYEISAVKHVAGRLLEQVAKLESSIEELEKIT